MSSILGSLWNSRPEIVYEKPVQKIVKEKISYLNKEHIIEQVKKKGYKKIDIESMHQDSFKLKSYFHDLKVDDARLKFKLVSSMTHSQNELPVG